MITSNSKPINAIIRSEHIQLGSGYEIQDNVILGSSADGQLIIGDNAFIRSGSVIYSGVKIGNNFKTGHGILIREDTEIGDNVLVGTDSVIDGHCKLGNNVSIQTDAYITAFTTIEDDVFIGPRVVTTNDKYMAYGNRLIGPTIKKGARIGANATILPGIQIGEDAIVGSGSVVTRDVPPGAMVAGNPARPLKKSITGKNRKIAVIGMGYVGIPAAVLLADAGYNVTGIQRRSERSGWRIDWLNEGHCPITNEPELPEVLKRVTESGRFRVTDDYSTIQDADIILVDVQTDIHSDNIPRYEALKEACYGFGRHLRPGKTVIVESTVSPGTTEHLVKPILEQESGLKARLPQGFGLCFSYERVMVGRLIHNIREYPKIVGGIDEESVRAAEEMYKSIVKGGVYVTGIMTAEVAKTVENAYRDVQIAFANEVALLCESLGVNVYDVRKLVNGLPDDPSVPHSNPVRNMHYPGAGVGGHCLPKDTWLLLHGYNEYANSKNSYPASILSDARNLNDWMPVHMVDLLDSALKEAGKELRGSRICVLGYAFLENSDDPRNSPTVILVRELEKRRANYKIHDPFIERDGDFEINQNILEALDGCNAIVLMTGHDEYKSIEPTMLKGLMKDYVIVDGRDIFDSSKFVAEGFIYRGVGKGNSSPKGRKGK
ncbi:MAG: nucleotide sugar dehydrogenase [Dehalococcoidales bacterium]|nr:nucleotide sugar dehydrogenase [Dehalococcoidales bacterium]